MNIVRLCYEWPPPWGGFAPGPFELTAAQVARGHQVRVLSGGWPRHPVAPLDGVQVRRLPSALPRLSLFATTAPAVLPFLLAAYRWADVIHGHQHLPVWYHLLRRLTGTRKPYVLHLDITAAGRAAQSDPASLDFWTRRFEWPLHHRSDRWGAQAADALVVVSDHVREEAIRLCGAPPEKIHIVHNGVNGDRFTPDGDNRRAALGIPADARVILFTGVLTGRKRPGLLIEALPHLAPDWHLLLVGRGLLQSQLAARARELGVDRRVHFAGYVPYPALAPFYRSADVFALPALYEGFPKVVLEALAAGVPVATTRSFVPDATLEPYLTWLDDDAPPAIAAALREAAAREVDVAAVRAAYDWSVKAAALDRIYAAIGAA